MDQDKELFEKRKKYVKAIVDDLPGASFRTGNSLSVILEYKGLEADLYETLEGPLLADARIKSSVAGLTLDQFKAAADAIDNT